MKNLPIFDIINYEIFNAIYFNLAIESKQKYQFGMPLQWFINRYNFDLILRSFVLSL